jgi:hypothetical protein
VDASTPTWRERCIMLMQKDLMFFFAACPGVRSAALCQIGWDRTSGIGCDVLTSTEDPLIVVGCDTFHVRQALARIEISAPPAADLTSRRS